MHGRFVLEKIEAVKIAKLVLESKLNQPDPSASIEVSYITRSNLLANENRSLYRMFKELAA